MYTYVYTYIYIYIYIYYRMMPCPLVTSSSEMALPETAPLDPHTLAGAGSG